MGRAPLVRAGLLRPGHDFYLAWDAISRDPDRLDAWLREWVHGISGRAEYLERLGEDTRERLRPGPALSGEVDYGAYR